MKDKRWEVRAPSFIQIQKMKTNKLWNILMMFVLVLGTTISFSSCSKDDDDDNKKQETTTDSSNQQGITTDNNNQQQGTTVDMTKIFGHWSVDSETRQELFSFSENNGMYYEYDNLDDDNWEAVLASGTYTVSGNVITASFNSVYVVPGGNKKVMGFTDKTNTSAKYTITKIETSGKETVMTLVNGMNGETLLLYKY